MPYEETFLRQRMRRGVDRAQQTGRVREEQFPLYPMGTAPLQVRDNALFDDITGTPPFGLVSMENLTLGG